MSRLETEQQVPCICSMHSPMPSVQHTSDALRLMWIDLVAAALQRMRAAAGRSGSAEGLAGGHRLRGAVRSDFYRDYWDPWYLEHLQLPRPSIGWVWDDILLYFSRSAYRPFGIRPNRLCFQPHGRVLLCYCRDYVNPSNPAMIYFWIVFAGRRRQVLYGLGILFGCSSLFGPAGRFCRASGAVAAS
jgi:hypothetical protein